ncbi:MULTISPECIES: FG-GAP repeat domain-containing protein [Streptomyces]|uniref:FG-GAP repeat domain-containing protein n=1 Tax=Streptomyces TaxID=1883 RepID=UPI0012392785|nr:VCBS repeat-containing protein [Streptomyces venezuelae]
MIHVRVPRRRLAGAVTAVVAVTATGLAAPSASAAPNPSPASTMVSAEQGTEQQDVLTMPVGTVAHSSGPTGFLASHGSGSAISYTWTRHKDGVRTQLPGQLYGGIAGTDIVVRSSGTVRTHVDMSTGTELMTYDVSTLDGTYAPKLYLGTGFVASTSAEEQPEPYVFGQDAQGRLVSRKLTGLPTGATNLRFTSGTPGTFLISYLTRANGVDRYRLAVADTASASVVETYETLKTTNNPSVPAVSPTHVAWIEQTDPTQVTLAVVRRGATEVERTPLGAVYYRTTVRLMGDWVVAGVTHGGIATSDTPDYTLTARPLKGGTAEGGGVVDLLDHVTYTTQSPDGSLIATGGTLEHGEGLYRIALDPATGKPAASLLASTGVPTAFLLTKETAPSGVVDLDRNGGSLKASWTFSRHNALVGLVLTHTASGLQWTSYRAWQSSTVPYTFDWNGLFDRDDLPAYNGAYTWTMTASPANGIGDDIVRTGGFTLTRTPERHDVNDNGSPDLLVRSQTGKLTAFDGGHVLNTADTSAADEYQPRDLGTGWNTYALITATGDIGGTKAGDLVGLDKTGALWLHQGNGRGLAPRTRVGGGWQIYNKLAGGSDLTGDGRPDLLATDTAGVLWLYKATGSATAPFAKRVKVGGGWGAYSELTATGDIGGAATGDLVARDRDGGLWLYLGKGDGTFAPRTKVGNGWNAYTKLIGIGDTDGDGRNDLVAYDEKNAPDTLLHVYKGSGNWKAPFATGQALRNHGMYYWGEDGRGLATSGHHIY